MYHNKTPRQFTNKLLDLNTGFFPDIHFHKLNYISQKLNTLICRTAEQYTMFMHNHKIAFGHSAKNLNIIRWKLNIFTSCIKKTKCRKNSEISSIRAP